MKKRLMRCMALAFCLCLLLSGSITAMAATGEIILVDDEGGGGAPATPSEPEKESKYTITIAAPRGWYTKAATVTVKLEDVNGTGFEKAEAKIGTNGAWQDMTDSLRSYGWAHVELSDNATVYVTVTDKKGKAHVKSLYIECFDRESPTAKARVEGRTLRAEADDALSGVECFYVNGYRFDDLTNGTLDIRVKECADADEEYIFVYAVDYAGNRSKTVSVKNPNYAPPSSSKAESSQAPASSAPASSAPAATTPAASAPSASQPAAPVVSQPAASASAQSTAVPVKKEPEQPAASETPDNGSVTPTDGTGTVIENSFKTPDQREFFTISTEAGNDYYIVVDKQKTDKNVYLLSEVTEDDLTGLAKESDNTQDVPLPEPVPEVKPAPEPEPPADEAPQEPQTAPKIPSDAGMYVIVVIVVLAFGVGAYYFKIVKPKRDAAYPDEDDEDMEMDEDESDYPDDEPYPDNDLYLPDGYLENEFEQQNGDGAPREESGESDA